MKHIALFSAGAVGSVIASFFGGWSAAMTTLLIFMTIDYVSGLIVAGVFHNSTKTETGALESRAGLKGLCRKGAMLLIVLIACRLDIMLTTAYVKDMVCIAFILNELISIVENFGLMGVPIPQIIVKAIDLLKKKNPSEKGGGTMTFDEFIEKYIGKAVDYDGSCGVQCVDFAKMVMKYVLGITPKAIGNAHAYFDDFYEHSFLKNNFLLIKNTPEFVPQKGDFCVWSKSMNGYGHIAIASGEGDTKHFFTYDQNWGGKQAKKVEHNYKYFLGVLRPLDQTAFETSKAIYFPKYTGDSISFSDALKEIGAKNRFDYRRKIAVANNIKAYMGTAQQNIKLFSMLKQGKLLKP
ncbi:MAG: phage holin family protein [Clostridia bacterium]|nr:phage holin family protein [Clostridia bacterium]